MVRAATVLSEVDDDEPYDGGAPAAVEVPNGLTGNQDAPRSRETQAQEPDEYQIVETDDELRPLTGPLAAPTQDIRTDVAPADTETQARERQSKAQRRQAQRAARERSEIELQRFREENARLRSDFEALQQTVTPRLDQIDQSRFNDQVASLQREIDGAAATVENAIVRMSNAISAGDVDAHAAALRDHTKAITRGYELAQDKARLEASRQAPRDMARESTQPRIPAQSQPRQSAAPDPVVRSRADEFLARNPWIDHRTWGDLDSKIAQEIDNSVVRDGFDPRDDDYWDELDARLRDAPQLSHRYQRAAPAQRPTQAQPAAAPQRRGPPVAGAGGAAPQGGPRQVRLSPERKAALMEVGALDREGRVADKAKFNRIARGYEEFDRTQGVARQ